MATNPNYGVMTPELEALAALSQKNSSIDPADYSRFDVKRGLRDVNGRGVVAGLTEVSDIVAKKIVDAFFDAEFEGGRHAVRVAMISDIEKKYGAQWHE